jgi:hypothetical protein
VLLWCIRSALSDLMPGETALPGIVDAGWDTFVVRYRREANWPMWFGLVAGSLVFILTPITTVGWPLPSFWLPRKVRDRHAYKVMLHPIYLVRQAVFLLKLNAGFCWGADPGVRAKLGMQPYPPEPTGWRT